MAFHHKKTDGIIQGDHYRQVIELLQANGWTVKRAGG